jgi:type VI protein secretion system component Hcp
MQRSLEMSRRSALRTLIAAQVGLTIGVATLTSAAPPTPSPTQVIGQVEIAGVNGEAGLEACPNCLILNSYDFLATKNGRNPPAYRKLEITSPLDAASPVLLRRLSLGTSIPTVTISLTRQGQDPFTYKRIILTNAKVSSFHEYVSGQGSDTPQIVVSFVYTRIRTEYTKQSPDGSAGDIVEFCWNLRADAVC